MIKMSIASTFYNDKEMLKKVLDSVLNQTYQNIEHCVADGGSTDGSVELLKEYEEKYRQAGKTLRWISERDKGITDGFNKAVKMATGDYIFPACCDPYAGKTVMEHTVSVIEEKKPDYVYGGMYFQRDRRKHPELERQARELAARLDDGVSYDMYEKRTNGEIGTVRFKLPLRCRL